MSKLKISLGILCLLAAGQAMAYPKWRNMPDQTIATPIGNIAFTKVKSIIVLGSLTIQGEMVNNTNKTWESLTFAVELSDKNGRVVPKVAPSASLLTLDPDATGQLRVSNFAPGATFKARFDKDVKADGDSLSSIFKYAAGAYPLAYKLALVKPMASDSMQFQDDAVSFTFAPVKTALSFILQNKGDAPIKVDWNTVSFVSPEGTAQGVVHNGVKLIDRTALKAPSMIPPRAKVEDQIVPVENIEMVDTEWVTHSLLPDGPLGLKMAGQEFSVFMPLDIGGTTKNYNFVFKIISAE